MTDKDTAEAEAEVPEPQTEFTESEWAEILLRRSQGDAQLVFNALAHTGGSIDIVPDPEPPEEIAIDETYEDAEADTADAKQKSSKK